jgi:IS1 family transposase
MVGIRYVERRLLLAKVEKLEIDITERDRLDAQIETCVASMFERQQSLEQTNLELNARLKALGRETVAAAVE